MIDVHSHILPGVDDGSASMKAQKTGDYRCICYFTLF